MTQIQPEPWTPPQGDVTTDTWRGSHYGWAHGAGKGSPASCHPRSPLDQIVASMCSELWAPLPNGPDDEFWWARGTYYVSTQGRVALVAEGGRPGRRFFVKTIRVERRPKRRPHTRTNLGVRPGVGPRYRPVRVHRLVAAAFLPFLRPEAVIVRHKNGDGTDNRLANLLRGTFSENLLDAYRLGERPYVPDPEYGF